MGLLSHRLRIERPCSQFEFHCNGQDGPEAFPTSTTDGTSDCPGRPPKREHCHRTLQDALGAVRSRSGSMVPSVTQDHYTAILAISEGHSFGQASGDTTLHESPAPADGSPVPPQ